MRENNAICIGTSQRSSIISACKNMATTVRSVFELGGAEVQSNDGYPGWKPNPQSKILKIAMDSYKRLFGEDAKVKAIHAGLECGLFLAKYPSLDMISFGPTIREVHSPDEKIYIPSVEKFWKYLIEVLRNVPERIEP
jgi:dipeptidase D